MARIPSGALGAPHSEFEDHMDHAGDALKAMRGPMRALDDAAQRDKAALLANTIALHMTGAIAVAGEPNIPDQAKSEYGDDKDRFVKDLRVGLTHAAVASTLLARALWQNDEAAIKEQYDTLRSVRKEGHNAFKQDDD